MILSIHFVHTDIERTFKVQTSYNEALNALFDHMKAMKGSELTKDEKTFLVFFLKQGANVSGFYSKTGKILNIKERTFFRIKNMLLKINFVTVRFKNTPKSRLIKHSDYSALSFIIKTD